MAEEKNNLNSSEAETPPSPLCYHLVGQIRHPQVRLYFEAEGREAGHTILWPGKLMEDNGVFGVQLLLLPT